MAKNTRIQNIRINTSITEWEDKSWWCVLSDKATHLINTSENNWQWNTLKEKQRPCAE